MTAAKQAGKQFLYALIHFLEGVLEARTCFSIYFGDGVFKCFQRVTQIVILFIHVVFAFAFLLELLDRRQVDRFQPRYPHL